ncbi:MAG: long-chain fatty acid--CoA ligase [Bdellovibrionaceae bacterium]|nr:long-chain fatty acid--CoA ligase [Bdellovibrionales bacterium]MCB9084765.1 long-chain fatty acid--CoA ligase [Pseudobdellovibrionaceae bacterium]
MERTITHCLLDALKRPETHVAVQFKSGQNWLRWSWRDFYREVESLAGFLHQKGIRRGDRIALFSSTRVEWLIADMAIMGLGAVTVPIYTSNREEDIEYILNDSQCKMILAENRELVSRFQNVAEQCPQVKEILVFTDHSSDEENITGWKEAIISGRRFAQEETDFLMAAIHGNRLNQLATIIYTSGTTGRPKGVVLTHTQIMSEVKDIFQMIGVDHRDGSLTFLPYAHILGRVEGWGALYAGFTLSFAENLEKLRKNLQEVRPTILIGVPRVFEKIYNGIRTQVEAHPLRHRLFNWAVGTGKRVSSSRLHRQPLSSLDLAQFVAAKQLVFAPLKEKLGGRLRFALSGGAPLSREIAEFFHAADILLLEGYGLTETTAAVTVNTPMAYCFGTVGKAFGDVEVKIAEDGEVLVKSQKVMTEYYNNHEATKAAFTEGGFFRTGDIGEFNDEGFLRITDRKKDLIKTAGGKYVAPQKLENLLKLNKYVSQVLIHGDRRKYIVALVTLNPENIEDFAQQYSVSYSDVPSLTQHPRVKELIRDAIADVNSQLSSFETIKNFAVLPHDFTVESGELTPSLKVRRRFCDEKFKDVLDRLYGVDGSVL